MKLELSDQELLVIGEALGDMPFKKSAATLASIQRQINEQRNESSESE